MSEQVAVAESGRIIAWVPGKLSNPLNGAHGHWSVKAKARKGWRERTRLCVGGALYRAGILADTAPGAWCTRERWPSRVRKVVVLTAYVWNLYDDDGLAAALKGCVDGLVDARVLHSDGPNSGHRIERRQQINRTHRGVEIVVEPRGQEG